MKKALYFLVVAMIAMAFSPALKFTITGNIAGLPDRTVYLKQRVEGNVVNLDSAKSVGGKFVLKGSVANPEQCLLVLGDGKQVSLFVENKDIQVTGKSDDPRNVTITGSASQDEMNSLDAKGTELNSKMKEFYDKYNDAKKQSNQAEMTKWEKQIDALDSTQTVMMKNFIAGNPKSFVAPVILQRIQYGMEADEIDGYLKKLSADVKKGSAAKSLAERVTVLRAVAVGMTAPDFTQNDSINAPVKLSDVYSKHKYTLIDFWASWCGPCRGENPNVVAVWKDFNAKGFHVMGVSYDTDKAKWLKAVATDKLAWTQVSDLKGWSNATAKIYGINSIPANLLLDNKGKIIGKNLRGDKLRAKITELLK